MKKKIKVALVGNPNSGKSSLFNALTGLRQKIGNYPGVTVDKKTGIVKLAPGLTAEIIDFPGTYSLYPKARDEEIVYEILLNQEHADHPDIVVIVADASNLKRNLLFCSQIMDLQIPVILALNMMDIAREEGILIEEDKLANELGIPVVVINARKNLGIDNLKSRLTHPPDPPQKPFIPASPASQALVEELKKDFDGKNDYTLIHYTIGRKKLPHLSEQECSNIDMAVQAAGFQSAQYQGEETLKRYARINEIIENVVTYPAERSKNLTAKIDKILTHKVWGYVAFIVILMVVFQSVFAFADYPMQWVELGTAALSEWLETRLPANWMTDLLVNGIIAGLSGVIIFIPQIAILFGFLTILEDTGYLSRISFLTDRLMRSVGLNGKSVIPMMSGFACAIPAIMATRNIDNWKDRLITILVTPFMSCSARLPVYALLIALAVPDRSIGFFNLKGLVLFAMYMLGILMALLVAWTLSFLMRKKPAGFFIMELPIYRAPRWKNVLYTMYERAKVFTVEAGKVIMIISIALWFLASYGPGHAQPDAVADSVSFVDKAEDIQYSYAGIIGKSIEPAIAPLGFDWKIGIALITSFAAREVFVGTMATIFSVEEDDSEDYRSIRERMRQERNDEGEPVYGLAMALSLMVFYAFAMQCMSTLAVVKRETKSWKWPIIQFAYMTVIAYISSLIVYQLFS